MDKETSARVSTIAAGILDSKPVIEDGISARDYNHLLEAAKTLAGSCMSQDEHPGQEPENFYDRLKRERAQLSGRIDALNLMTQRGFPGVADDQQRELLECQLETMRVYYSILGMRLKHIAEPDRMQGKLRLASTTDPSEPVEVGGHDIDRDGPLPFAS